MGRMLIITGSVMVLMGFLLTFGPKLPFGLGHLPYLDFYYQGTNVSFYFPLGSSILVSIVLSLVFALLRGK